MEFPIDLDSVPTGHPHAWGLTLSITTTILDMAVLKGAALWSVTSLHPNQVEPLKEYVTLAFVL
jgi:hypothetical protein